MPLLTKLYLGYIASSTVICGLLAPSRRPTNFEGEPYMNVPTSIIKGSTFGFLTGLIPGFLPGFLVYSYYDNKRYIREEDEAFKKYKEAGMTEENRIKYINGGFGGYEP